MPGLPAQLFELKAALFHPLLYCLEAITPLALLPFESLTQLCLDALASRRDGPEGSELPAGLQPLLQRAIQGDQPPEGLATLGRIQQVHRRREFGPVGAGFRRGVALGEGRAQARREDREGQERGEQHGEGGLFRVGWVLRRMRYRE